MELRSRFKKFDGEFISDIVEYLKEFIKKEPTVTISVGCDSIQKKRKTLYAVTLMIYNHDIKNGAHVVFFRDNSPKIRDNFQRLSREVELALKIADFLEVELGDSYIRMDLTDYERKKYKFHISKCNGEFPNLSTFEEVNITKGLFLTDSEQTARYKLIDVHLDFNYKEGKSDSRGYSKNRSYIAYKAFVPYLRGNGYRVWVKPLSFASSSAADLLVQD
jgi:predicted RNase H-related nuclease YkuK (DUF458 family)